MKILELVPLSTYAISLSLSLTLYLHIVILRPSTPNLSTGHIEISIARSFLSISPIREGNQIVV